MNQNNTSIFSADLEITKALFQRLPVAGLVAAGDESIRGSTELLAPDAEQMLFSADEDASL